MALKPTIYKFSIDLSDINRNYYDTLNLTIAQHPSETVERMMVRVLAFCINAQEQLSFTKGLSATEEPDLWVHSLDGNIELWIDVGEPAVDRIKKATRIARDVKVYSFNRKSETWWQQERTGFENLAISVFQFNCDEIKNLATLIQRTMNMSVTISEDSAYIAAENGEFEVNWITLQSQE